jgi:hypothetical protein
MASMLATVNPVASRPITGRYLAHNRLPAVERAFIGADIYVGRRYVVEWTEAAVADLVHVSPTYVH